MKFVKSSSAPLDASVPNPQSASSEHVRQHPPERSKNPVGESNLCFSASGCVSRAANLEEKSHSSDAEDVCGRNIADPARAMDTRYEDIADSREMPKIAKPAVYGCARKRAVALEPRQVCAFRVPRTRRDQPSTLPRVTVAHLIPILCTAASPLVLQPKRTYEFPRLGERTPLPVL